MAYHVHSKKKSTSEHLFWCFRLSQIEDSIQYLEGSNSTWKDHDRNIFSPMVLPGTIWSFQVLNRVLYLWQSKAPKKVLRSTFFLRVHEWQLTQHHWHKFTQHHWSPQACGLCSCVLSYHSSNGRITGKSRNIFPLCIWKVTNTLQIYARKLLCSVIDIT